MGTRLATLYMCIAACNIEKLGIGPGNEATCSYRCAWNQGNKLMEIVNFSYTDECLVDTKRCAMLFD